MVSLNSTIHKLRLKPQSSGQAIATNATSASHRSDGEASLACMHEYLSSACSIRAARGRGSGRREGAWWIRYRRERQDETRREGLSINSIYHIFSGAARGYCPERRAAAAVGKEGEREGIDRWMDGASVLEREQPAYHA